MISHPTCIILIQNFINFKLWLRFNTCKFIYISSFAFPFSAIFTKSCILIRCTHLNITKDKVNHTHTRRFLRAGAIGYSLPSKLAEETTRPNSQQSSLWQIGVKHAVVQKTSRVLGSKQHAGQKRQTIHSHQVTLPRFYFIYTYFGFLLLALFSKIYFVTEVANFDEKI